MEKLIGILIEPRKLKQVHYVVKNFFEVLPNVKLYFFCVKNLKQHYDDCFKLYKNLNIIELGVNNLTSLSYSDLLKSVDFWNQFDAEYALTIQTDGCLCKNSTLKIDRFFDYDFVGGYASGQWNQLMKPIIDVNKHFPCFNGGFSLRNISKSLSVLTSFPPLSTSNNPTDFKEYPEDIYFVYGMLKLGFNVGIDHFATTFCTHKYFVKNSFCIHNFFKYSENNTLEECFRYCPEYKEFINIEPWHDDNQYDNQIDNNEPHIGVVIARYSQINDSTSNQIKKCLNSVLKQTYKHYSIIVIGNDYTHLYEINKLITSLNKKMLNKVYFYNVERSTFDWDKTSLQSCNGRLPKCEINYYAYLDDNDFWKPNHLQLIVNARVSNKETNL